MQRGGLRPLAAIELRLLKLMARTASGTKADTTTGKRGISGRTKAESSKVTAQAHSMSGCAFTLPWWQGS